jgi:hypothetical protein
MLFMVIEQFRDGDPLAVRTRFRERGRMLPDGVTYHASWIDPSRARCFQVMEAADVDALQPWLDAWNDLVEFEVIPVLPSADFWAKLESVTTLVSSNASTFPTGSARRPGEPAP